MLVIGVGILLITILGGCSPPPSRLEAPALTTGAEPFCAHIQQLAAGVKALATQRSKATDIVRRLARIRDGFSSDAAEAFARGNQPLGMIARRVAAALELTVADLQALIAGGSATNLEEHVRAAFRPLQDLREGFCVGPKKYRWVVDQAKTVEVSVPADWAIMQGPLKFRDADAGNTGLIASSAPSAWETYYPAWIFPGVSLSRSESLASALALKDVRFGLAMSRLRVWAQGWDRSDQCRREGVSPYAKSVYYGFLTRWDDCGGLGVHLWEAFVMRVLPDHRVLVMHLEATAWAPGDAPVLQRILDSFHAVTG